MLYIAHRKQVSLLSMAPCLSAIACTPSAEAVNSIQNEQAGAVDDDRGPTDATVERDAPFTPARHSGGLSGGRLTRLSGTLTLSGTCLTLSGRQGEYALIWPRHATARQHADGRWAIDLVSPQGVRSLVVGDQISVSGYGGARSVVQGAEILQNLASDCPDKAWIVQGLVRIKSVERGFKQ
jgi:hypothetical protein